MDKLKNEKIVADIDEKSKTDTVKAEEVAKKTDENTSTATKNADVENVDTDKQETSETIKADTKQEETADTATVDTENTAEIDNAELVAERELTEEEKEQLEYEKLRAEAKWYVLHTFSSYENVAKENLEIVIDKYNLQKRVFDIVIPMEDVMEEKNGKRKIVSRKVMPGYIIVKMIYGDDIWHAITRTRGITGFVGPKGRPLPLTSEEIRKMKLEKVEIVNIDVAIGDKVEVLEGALYGFVGEIIALDIDANKCRVMVEMFGRETPVDLTLEQIRKLNQ